MIIPQIAENLTQSGNLEIPDTCPVCGQEAKIICENDVEALYCMNPDCVAKKIKAFTPADRGIRRICYKSRKRGSRTFS